MPLINKVVPRSNHVFHSKHPSSADSHAPYASPPSSSSVVESIQDLPRQTPIPCLPISAATSSFTPSSPLKSISPSDPLRNSQYEPITDETSQSSLAELKLLNKQKDMAALYKMLSSIIEWEERSHANPEKSLTTIASLAGGAEGITFKDKDLDCIRYRYGRNSTEPTEIGGSIILEKLHRAFIVLQAGKIPTQDISSDLNILKSKICFILHKELALHSATLPPLLASEEIAFLKKNSPVGNPAPLVHIYQYVQEHYYHISLEHIKKELQYFSENIETKDDLYFIARKFIIIGELGCEIKRDIEKLDLDTQKPFLSVIDALTPFINWRDQVIHFPDKLIEKFNKSPEALNKEIETQVSILTSTLNAMSADDLAKARKKPKNMPSTRHPSKTKNGKPSSSLPLSDAIPKVNAKKIVEKQKWFDKFIEKRPELNNLMANIENFQITTKEKCTELLLIFATQEIQKQRTIEKQSYQALLKDLEKLASAYTSKPVSAKSLTKELLSKHGELCQKLAEEMGISVTELINTADSVWQTLNYIAPEKNIFIWQAKQDGWKGLVSNLNEAYEAYDIADIKLPTKQKPTQKKVISADLLKAIQQEMDYISDLDVRMQDPIKKQVITEYIVTVVGQYMRELNEIAPLKEHLLSHTAHEAGSLMQQHRSKGLAHEVLRFDPDEFETDFRAILLPAARDFQAANIVNQYKNIPSPEIQMLYVLAEAYTRLCFYDEAINNLEKALNKLTKLKGVPNVKEASFELNATLIYTHHQKGDNTKAIALTRHLFNTILPIPLLKPRNHHKIVFLHTLMGNDLLTRKNFPQSMSHFIAAYQAAKITNQREKVVYSIIHCQEEAQKYGVFVNLPENLNYDPSASSLENQFDIQFMYYCQDLNREEFTEARKKLKDLREFLQKNLGALKEEVGDRYQLCELMIFRAEMSYQIKIKNISSAILADFEDKFQHKLTQLSPTLKHVREIYFIYHCFSGAYTELGKVESQPKIAINLFNRAEEKITQLATDLPFDDELLISAINNFGDACYSYQIDTLEDNFELSIFIFNKALNIAKQYGVEAHPNLLTRLGYIHLQEGEKNLRVGKHEQARIFYGNSVIYLEQAKTLFEKNSTKSSSEQENYEKAILSLGSAYGRLGIVYSESGQITQSQKYLKLAITLYDQYLKFLNIPTAKRAHLIKNKEEYKIKLLSLSQLIHFSEQVNNTFTSNDKNTMKHTLLKHFNEAIKNKRKSILFKNIKDVETFEFFLLSSVGIAKAEIERTKLKNYIIITLSEKTKTLINAFATNH